MGHIWDLVPVITLSELLENTDRISSSSLLEGRSVNFYNDSLKNFYTFDKTWAEENLYLVCTRRKLHIT